MDARITKSRLANLLSYDWLKILLAIAAAVLAICVFFTTVKTRPRANQVFSVYGYRELFAGEASSSFMERLKTEGVFSYDVLEVQQETFGTGQYADTAFAARRSAGEGTVMFTTTNRTNADDPSVTVLSELLGGDMHDLALDLDVYLADCENYLIRFFGENWQEGELNTDEARQCFLKRNDGDRRYRAEDKKQEGILQEYERLRKLRVDYQSLTALLEAGTLSYADVTDDEGVTHHKAFRLGQLKDLRNFYYYNEEADGQSFQNSANVCMILLHNDDDAGKPADLVQNDLRYEAVSFLCALTERFGG